MTGTLGEKLGEGALADIHAWAPGQVVKLARAGVPRRIVLHETRMTRAVFAAGGPAPEVLDEVVVEGRRGIVLPHYQGATLRDLSRSGAMTHAQAGSVLAQACLAIHRAPLPAEVLPLDEWMEGSLRVNGAGLPETILKGIPALIDRLAPGDGLCHGDLHPGNIIVTPDGPRIIDWLGAVRGPAALDLACCQVLLTEVIPGLVPDPERPHAINASLQTEYARLIGLTPAALALSVAVWRPVAHAIVLLGGGAPGLRGRLIADIQAALDTLA